MIGGAIGGGSAALAPAVATAAGKGAGAGLVERARESAAIAKLNRSVGKMNKSLPSEGQTLVAPVGRVLAPGERLDPKYFTDSDEEDFQLGGGVIDPAKLPRY